MSIGINMTMGECKARGVAIAVLDDSNISALLKIERESGGVPKLVFDAADALNHPLTLYQVINFCKNHRIGLRFINYSPMSSLNTRMIAAFVLSKVMTRHRASRFVFDMFPGGEFVHNVRRTTRVKKGESREQEVF